MRLSVFLTVLVLAACACRSEPIPEEIDKEEAIEIAEAALEENLPQVDRNRLRAHAQDTGASWQISFHPPLDSVGGPIIVNIHKRTREVSSFEFYQ